MFCSVKHTLKLMQLLSVVMYMHYMASGATKQTEYLTREQFVSSEQESP